MKKLILLAALGFASMAAVPAKAQVSVSINIGAQPQWGPRGYNHVDYYYLPDIQCYYYVPTKQFIYLNGSNWIHSRYLPSRYKGYNLYNGRKVVINSPRPYLHHNVYRTRYAVNNRHVRPNRVVVNQHRGSWNNHHSTRGHEDHGRKHESHGRKHESHGRSHH